MENRQQLVFTEQHSMNNRFYVIEVFKGQAYRNARYEYKQVSYEKIVQIKAFSILISEIIMEDGAPKKVLAASFPYCTSRTGDFMTAIVLMKERRSILEIEFMMENTRSRFNVALDRDAQKAMKKLLGLYKKDSAYTVTSSTFYNSASPKIK